MISTSFSLENKGESFLAGPRRTAGNSLTPRVFSLKIVTRFIQKSEGWFFCAPPSLGGKRFAGGAEAQEEEVGAFEASS